jgi:hypothetical protein
LVKYCHLVTSFVAVSRCEQPLARVEVRAPIAAAEGEPLVGARLHDRDAVRLRQPAAHQLRLLRRAVEIEGDAAQRSLGGAGADAEIGVVQRAGGVERQRRGQSARTRRKSSSTNAPSWP